MVTTKDMIEAEDRTLDLILNKKGEKPCIGCDHWLQEEDTCLAFPDGIPFKIWQNHEIHDQVIKGQTGDFVFTPMTEENEKKFWEA